MSQTARRRLFAPLCNVAFVSLLSAAFVGSVGCSGGSNPFCCNSKEKSQIDQTLERAQSLDENEKNSTPPEENSDAQEREEGEKKTRRAGILPTDGSGDAPQLAVDATLSTPKNSTQETPVTVSTTAATTSASNSAKQESTELLQAPVLPSTAQTLQAPPSDDAANENAAEAQDAISETPAQTADAPETPTTASDSPADENASSESQEAQTAPQEPATQNAEKTAETPIAAGRSTKRGGPQRAASRQIARRPIAVPQTRADATLDAPAPVVTFRTRAVVPAVAPSPVVTFRTRTIVP